MTAGASSRGASVMTESSGRSPAAWIAGRAPARSMLVRRRRGLPFARCPLLFLVRREKRLADPWPKRRLGRGDDRPPRRGVGPVAVSIVFGDGGVRENRAGSV